VFLRDARNKYKKLNGSLFLAFFNDEFSVLCLMHQPKLPQLVNNMQERIISIVAFWMVTPFSFTKG
jgi:hypothetical protein